MNESRRWWLIIALFCGAALVLELFYIFEFRTDFQENVLPTGQLYRTQVWGDGLVYSAQANYLVDGEGLVAPLPRELFGVVQESADHPPLYTLYLAAWSLVGVKSQVGHMVVTALASSLTPLTFGILGRRVAGATVGLVAGFFGAFTPSIWTAPGFVLAESLTVPLAALAAFFAYRTLDDPTVRNAVWLGLFTGLATQARAELSAYVLFAVVPLILVVLRRQSWRQRITMLAGAGVACAAVVLPWVGYNLNRFEEPVYMSIGLDYSVAQANCDESYSAEFIGYYWLGCMGEALEGTGLTYVDQSLGAAHLRETGVDYALDHRRRAVTAVAARLGRVAGVFHPMQQARLNSLIAGREPWLANAAVLLWYPMAALAAVGYVMLHRRGRAVFPLLALVAVTAVAVAMSLAVLRYRAPLEPVLAVGSAVALTAAARFVGRAWRDTETVPQ
ncbi:MAG: glycosyltransferase family 39 protein [Acidimicrobiales bacterium]